MEMIRNASCSAKIISTPLARMLLNGLRHGIRKPAFSAACLAISGISKNSGLRAPMHLPGKTLAPEFESAERSNA